MEKGFTIEEEVPYVTLRLEDICRLFRSVDRVIDIIQENPTRLIEVAGEFVRSRNEFRDIVLRACGVEEDFNPDDLLDDIFKE